MNQVHIYIASVRSETRAASSFAVIMTMGEHKKNFTVYEERLSPEEVACSTLVFGLSRLKWPCKVTVFSSDHLVLTLTNSVLNGGEKLISLYDKKILKELTERHQVSFERVDARNSLVQEALNEAQKVLDESLTLIPYLLSD